MKQQSFLNMSVLVFMVTNFTTICILVVTSNSVRSAEIIKSVKTGNISELFRSLRDIPFHFKENDYKSYYKKTYEETTPNWKFPTVRNLDQYLAPFTQCFVHVTNGQNVDLQQHSMVPILVRYQSPAKISDATFCRNECLTWLPPGMNVTGAPLKKDGAFDCPLSKYKKDTTITKGICSSIDRWNFSLNIRPWSCEVTVALFPPLYVFATENLMYSQMREMWLWFPPIWIPSVLALSNKNHFESNVFNILILDELYEQKFYMGNAFKWKENIISVEESHALALDTFTIFNTKRVGTQHKVFKTESEITKIVVPFLCETLTGQPCKDSTPNGSEIDKKIWLTGTTREVHRAGSLRFQNLWLIHSDWVLGKSQEQNILNHFHKCENLISHRKSWVNLPFTSIPNRFAHAVVHVWLSIMGNYTYYVNGYECSNGVLQEVKTDTEINPYPVYLRVEQIINPQDRQSYMFTILDTFTSLKFVSCGRPKETGLPFEKLVNEFDWKIWILLVICLGALVFLVDSDVITKQSFGVKIYMRKNLNRLQFHSKVLVEQSSAYLAAPYMPLITQAIFILVAVVISNAYKGENVFQLISNRKVIPYHYFSELVKSNFEIYSRVDNLDIMRGRELHFNTSLFMKQQHHILNRKLETSERTYFKPKNLTDKDVDKILSLRSRYLAMSEVFKFISDFVVYNYERCVPSKEFNILKTVWKNTKILPEFTKLYKNVEAEVEYAVQSEDYDYIFQTSLLKKQERHIFEILRKCNKVAVILPALTCHQIARNLTEIENPTDVYVGEELLYNQSSRIRISGLVPLNHIMRAKYVLGSGIWDFWSEIFQHRATFREYKSSDTQPVAPSMSGNISVVFTIVLFGFACAIAVFVIEIRGIIYGCGKAASKLIKRAFIVLYKYLLCAPVAKHLDWKRMGWFWIRKKSIGPLD
ncbi:unnamed protein product [Orchesella dallaii]|uniref:Uncharacterized protein n=1 Tax=Orchesella dallaii TaxID=48710 RepID=A0ABP1RMQ0_9HEXA